MSIGCVESNHFAGRVGKVRALANRFARLADMLIQRLMRLVDKLDKIVTQTIQYSEALIQHLRLVE